MDQELLKEAIRAAEPEVGHSYKKTLIEKKQVCGDCHDSYARLGTGLVQPRLIAFNECLKTSHRGDCECSDFLHDTGFTGSIYSTQPDGDEDESDVDEEFFMDEDDALDQLCDAYERLHLQNARMDPFQDAATLLYRAQARKWLGSYGPNEVLCATCFLRRERYLGPDGQWTKYDFTPMPESYGAVAAGHTPYSTL